MRIYNGVPLRDHSLLGIGGKADYMVLPKDVEELVESVKHCLDRGMDYVVVGSGSGVLFTDKGYRGCVIVTDRMKMLDFRNEVVAAESGACLNTLIESLAEQGISGMERLYGIPGTVGGAVYTNAAYFGVSIGEFVHSIVSIDSDGIIVNVAGHDIGFSNKRGFWGGLIVSVQFDMKAFKGASKDEILGRMASYKGKKAESQPVGMQACRLFENVGGDSVAHLIRKANLGGLAVGGAALWENNPSFVVNLGDAKASDVMSIIKRISDELGRQAGVDVEVGIQVIGEL